MNDILNEFMIFFFGRLRMIVYVWVMLGMMFLEYFLCVENVIVFIWDIF